jgi:hypothetical protein
MKLFSQFRKSRGKNNVKKIIRLVEENKYEELAKNHGIALGHMISIYDILGYHESTDSIEFKCSICKSIYTSPNPPLGEEKDFRCEKCKIILTLLNYSRYEEWKKDVIKKKKARNKRIAQSVIPFVASSCAVLLTYAFFSSEGESPFGWGTAIVLIIFGGFCFAFGFVILREFNE